MCIPIAALFLPEIALLISLGVLTLISLAFELLRLRAPVLSRWFIRSFKPSLKEEEESHLTGASYMLFASLIAFLAFPRDIAVLALSGGSGNDDNAALAGLVAQQYVKT